MCIILINVSDEFVRGVGDESGRVFKTNIFNTRYYSTVL